MPKAQRFPVEGYEQTDLPILAHVKYNGNDVHQSDLTAVSFNAKKSDGTYAGGGANTGALVVSSVVYDALQVNDRWQKDLVGYNFLGIIPAAALPTSGQWEIEIKFTPVSGSPFWIIVQAALLSLHSV